MMGKRKQQSPLDSEPSSKIRHISTASDQGPVRHDSALGILKSLSDDPSPLIQGHPEAASPRSTQVPLTKENLRQWNRMAGSKGPRTLAPTESNLENTRSNSRGSTSISTTDPTFKSKFRANGGLNLFASAAVPLSNESTIEQRLNQSRSSESPPPSLHQTYGELITDAPNELMMQDAAANCILQPINYLPKLRESQYSYILDKQWTAYPSDVGFNDGLSAPKPDRSEGFRRAAFPPSIDQLDGSATLVGNDSNFVALPHLALEFKHFTKNFDEAEVQAAFDGAAMVYARNRALAYLGQPDPPRHAHVVTAVSNGFDWKAYGHYSRVNDATGKLEYYQYLLNSGNMLKYADFKVGRKVLRNLQDYALEQANDLRERLYEHYKANGVVPLPLALLDAFTDGGSVNGGGSSSVVSKKASTLQAPPSRYSDTQSKRDGKLPVSPLPKDHGETSVKLVERCIQ